MLKLYATCPQSKDLDRSGYLDAVARVSAWSERAGCTGILVYTDNGIVDPWLVSQAVIESTQRLCPLVAVQPVYLHPYSTAKMVASLAYLYGRQVHLNMLAGGFRNDLLALGDPTPHDERYERTVEYTRIAMALLRGQGPVTVQGRYYSVANLQLTPAVPAELVPEVLMSGSSPAGLAAARAVGATPVKYPQPPGEEQSWVDGDTAFGVRVGIVARPDADEAWRVARERFPEDRTGQITHRVAVAVSDSHWHHQLSARAGAAAVPDPVTDEPDPYWLGPFQNYKTFCPYLVGSYDGVAQMLVHYMDVGASTFVLDIPASEAELAHIGVVFTTAQAMVARETVTA